jgi:hypothetical protein
MSGDYNFKLHSQKLERIGVEDKNKKLKNWGN